MAREQLLRLRERRANVHAQQTEILDRYPDGNLSAEDETRYQALETEFATHERAIAREEANEEREGRLTQIDRRSAVLPTANGGQRAATEVIERYNAAFGVYLRYGRDGMNPEQAEDLRAGYQRATPQEAAQIRAQAAGTGSAGGYLVPTEFEDQILRVLTDESAVRQAVVAAGGRILTTDSGNNILIPKAASHGAASWIAENDPVPFTDETFGQADLGANIVARGTKIPLSLVEDAAIDIAEYVSSEIGTAIGLAEDTAFVTGDGSGKPRGFLLDATLGKTGASGQTTSVTFDDVIDLVYSVAEPYRRRGAFMLRDATKGVIRKIKDGEGRYVWSIGDVSKGLPDTILGYRAYSDPAMPAMAASAKSLAFGDFGQYRIRQVRGIAVVRVNELFMANLQVGFIGWHRVDGELLVPTAVKYYQNAAS